MGKVVVTITTYGPKGYHVELPTGKVYVLNRHSLCWNMRHVMGLDAEDMQKVLEMIDKNGNVQVKFAAEEKAS